MAKLTCRECGMEKDISEFEIAQAERLEPPRGIGIKVKLGELEFPVCKACVGDTMEGA